MVGRRVQSNSRLRLLCNDVRACDLPYLVDGGAGRIRRKGPTARCNQDFCDVRRTSGINSELQIEA